MDHLNCFQNGGIGGGMSGNMCLDISVEEEQEQKNRQT